MIKQRAAVALGLSASLMSGCSLLNLSDNYQWPTDREFSVKAIGGTTRSEAKAPVEPKVANPPARTIRFDGREIVLGTGHATQIATGQFCTELSTLLQQEKYYTAALLVGKNPGVADQVIWERYSGAADDRLVSFLAATLSRDVSTKISWNGLLVQLASQPADAKVYQQSRASFVDKLKTGEPSDQETEQLRIVAQRLNHPLVMTDGLRLMALRELVAGRHAWAQSLFLQAAEIADQNGDKARSAELWMLAATTANRAERTAEAKDAWLKAVQRQIEMQLALNRPLNVNFWTRAEEQRPHDAPWPEKTSAALLSFAAPLGCKFTPQSPAEQVLWSAIAAAQYEDSQPQLALVNFKKAEQLAAGDDVLWLQIAQSKCLAALGQGQAAAALLSGPAASDKPSIAMASTAAIGSAKLRAGAYQQGAQLIGKALNESSGIEWPSRTQAEADYALAHLIIGDTDEGLKALHSAQARFQTQRDYVSLLQSLENELRILELEGRAEAAQSVRLRIREIERT